MYPSALIETNLFSLCASLCIFVSFVVSSWILPLRIGLHTSTAGSLENAAAEALELGANTFQIFSASPRMWRAPAPSPVAIAKLNALRQKHDLGPLVIHDNYLINLCAADPEIRAKSIAAFRGEVDRAIAIGAEYLVMHPGSAKGHASTEDAIATFAASIEEACRGRESRAVTILLENTAGQGSSLGRTFTELKALRDAASPRVALEVGFCLDTCHCLAAGFDVASEAGLAQTLALAGELLGLHRVPVIHANDSKHPLNSRLDRHANIGEGYIGIEGFRRILNASQLEDKAFILETPAEDGGALRDIETLKSLCRKNLTNTSR